MGGIVPVSIRIGHDPVDLLPEKGAGHRVQAAAGGVMHILHKALDLDVIGYGDKGRVGRGGKHQGVKAHGAHQLHPPQDCHGQLYLRGRGQQMAAAVHHPGRPFRGRHIGGVLDGHENSLQPITLPGVIRRLRKGGVVVKILPGPQGKANIPPLRVQAVPAEIVAGHLVVRRLQAQGRVGGIPHIGPGDAHILQGEADFAADVFSTVQWSDIKIACVIVRRLGRIAVLVGFEKIKLKLGAKLHRNDVRHIDLRLY